MANFWAGDKIDIEAPLQNSLPHLCHYTLHFVTFKQRKHVVSGTQRRRKTFIGKRIWNCTQSFLIERYIRCALWLHITEVITYCSLYIDLYHERINGRAGRRVISFEIYGICFEVYGFANFYRPTLCNDWLIFKFLMQFLYVFTVRYMVIIFQLLLCFECILGFCQGFC